MTITTAFDPVVEPPPIMPSIYGPELPAHRAKDIPGLVSLPVTRLFPDIPRALYHVGGDVTAIHTSTVDALSDVDMSMIRPEHTVNVICSEHGFGMDGGLPYAEMLTAIKEELRDRTGCTVRLIVVAWLGRKEPGELVEFFHLDERFDGNWRGATPLDHGIRIDTVLGPLYGVRKVYDADWIVHTHYDDPREIYLHRMIDRITKPFGMSYARMETRSIFHVTMGPRTGNLIGRAIADSTFVRQKLAFSVTLKSSPDGICGVDADNDLDALGNRVTANVLSAYGKMWTLIQAIEECIPVIDGGKWPYYNHAGGMIFGHLLYNGRDWLDLELQDPAASMEIVSHGMSKSIRAVVLNHSLIGLTVAAMPMLYPVVVSNPAMAESMRRDFSNSAFMDLAAEAPNLFEGVELAKERGGTDKLICFDGTFGAMNLSPSLAEDLLRLAPECSQRVDDDLLPRWLKQRGIDPEGLRR